MKIRFLLLLFVETCHIFFTIKDVLAVYNAQYNIYLKYYSLLFSQFKHKIDFDCIVISGMKNRGGTVTDRIRDRELSFETLLALRTSYIS